MKIIQTISLVIIAGVLAAEFWSTHIRPSVLLNTNRAEYLELSVQCEIAKSAVNQLAGQGEDLSNSELQKLEAAIRVDLVACRQREKLRQDFLSKGVPYSRLATIELESKEDDRIPIYTLVDRYAQEP